MLWSAGDKYIAKSLSDIEVSKAQSMLPNYFKHLETHPESLLTKYLAMFKMRISGKTTYVVIMKNVLDTGRWQTIYDLKGSTRGRICESSSNLLKDVNFTRSGTTIKFPTERALNNFKVVLQLDTGFLVRQGVLDYSLLLGTERDGREWQVGIIDIMTPFSPRKRMERMTMGRLHGKGTISCAPPPKYALRFFNFIQQSLEVNNNGV
jgi:1-phosphatidylinositol-3-phosphate 5-kinase